MKRTRSHHSWKRNVLETLLSTDLGFHGSPARTGPHGLHAFAAKFPPELPRFFIEALTDKGQVVLDPMVGSGTTLVEALALQRRAVGFDLDPLAILISSVKSSAVDPVMAMAALQRVCVEARIQDAENGGELESGITANFDSKTAEFLTYWFMPQTQQELMALCSSINQEFDPCVRQFLKAVLSSVIVTKSGGVSRARDLAHSRPHLDLSKKPKNAIVEFEKRGIWAAKNLGDFDHSTPSFVGFGDARCIPLDSAVVDCIITSPPYANAIDYVRAHKFSRVWLGESVEEMSRKRTTYIGYEGSKLKGELATLPALVRSQTEILAEVDQRKSMVVANYFLDMRLVICEMHRVLRTGGSVILVVGPSVMRDVAVRTQDCIAELMSATGFEVVGLRERALDRDRRLMPASRGFASLNGIEKRTHTEYVIGAIKP